MQAKRLLCTVAVALIASHGVHAQPATDVPITRFPSPYMHAFVFVTLYKSLCDKG